MITKSNFTLKSKLAIVTAIVFWSSAFVGIRIGLQGYSPGGLALLRFLVASASMALVWIIMPTRANPILRQDLIRMLFFGMFGIGFYNLFLNYAELSVSAGVASFIISQAPLITLIASIIFLRESFNWVIVLGVFISVIGVGLISLGHDHAIKFDIGLVYLLLAALVGGLFTVIQKPFLRKYNPLDVTVIIIWGGTAFLLIYTPDLVNDIETASWESTLAAVYLGIFPAGIAYYSWSYALANMSASVCSIFLYFMPIIATVLGWLCLGEVPSLITLLGGMVALLGVWIANKAFFKGG